MVDVVVVVFVVVVAFDVALAFIRTKNKPKTE